jgi:ketosteroid isomerase-like protein
MTSTTHPSTEHQPTEHSSTEHSSTERHEYVQLLDRIIAAAEAGDPADLLDIYAEGAVIWHNTSNHEQSVQQNMRVLAAMDRFVTNRRYEDRRFHVFDGGVVQQHVLRGIQRSSGEQVELKACVVVLVENGKITRLDEYFDSAEAERLRS